MRKVTGYLAVLLTVCFAFNAIPAFSEERPTTYIAVKGGLFTPTGDLHSAEFDSGFSGEAAVGWYFNPNVAAEAGVGYFQTSANVPGASKDDEINTVPILLSLKGVLPLGRAAEIYGGAGAGVYLADGDFQRSVTVGATNYNVTISENKILYGFQLLAGVTLDLTDTIFLGLEGKHHWTNQTTFETQVQGVPVSVETTLDGFITTFNLGVRF